MGQNETFDFIIIGGGSAGATLASRLSQSGLYDVLLIEAGGKNDDLLVNMPAGVGEILPTQNRHNWGFFTEPQAQLNNRKLYWPRGRGLGGSSAINAMIYTRGHPIDYDDWERMGIKGWNFQTMLKYFKKAEDFELGENYYHGAGGPLHVSVPNSSHQGFQMFEEATIQAQLPQTSDFNGPSNEGFGKYHLTIKDGVRCSSYMAYLKQNLGRKNLKILNKKIVIRLIIEDNRAIGVEYCDDVQSAPKKVFAKREIILSAGAIGSPQILLLSGIGPADELKSIGINPILNLPSVGKNLQDHLDISILQTISKPITYYSLASGLMQLKVGLEYIFFKRGFGRENFLEYGGFAKSHEELHRPNLQFHFLNGLFKDHNKTKIKKDGFTLHVCNLYPEARGEVTLRSKNPLASPRIEPNYLATEKDMEIMRLGVKMARRIFSQPAFAATSEFAPGANVQSDDEIDAFIRQNAETIYHPVGTCRMGADDDAVVDENMRVRNIKNLRVIDASIMPRIIGGNTNAPTIAIAEYGADLILAQK